MRSLQKDRYRTNLPNPLSPCFPAALKYTYAGLLTSLVRSLKHFTYTDVLGHSTTRFQTTVSLWMSGFGSPMDAIWTPCTFAFLGRLRLFQHIRQHTSAYVRDVGRPAHLSF
jgi:hypothetical protein